MVKKAALHQRSSSPSGVQSGIAKVGWILALTGGILGVFVSLCILVIGIFFVAISPEGDPDAYIVGIVFIVFSVYSLLTAVATIVGAAWMRKPATQLRGSIVALVCGVIGSGTLFGLIGGVLGLVDHSQRSKGE